jgi:hypothetical protein
MTKRKIEDILGRDRFRFRSGKGIRYDWDAENNTKTKFENRREILCFLYRLAEGRVNWTTLMQILKKIDINWYERRMLS